MKKDSRKVSPAIFAKKADDYIAKCELEKGIPLLMEFAYLLDIGDDTLRKYGDSPSYSKALKKVEKAQEIALVKYGITSNKPVFSIFLLKAKHGYKDMNNIDFTSNGETIGVVQLPARQAK